MLSTIIIITLVIYILLNLRVGKLYMELYNDSLVDTYKRPSFKIINDALLKAKSSDKYRLKRFKNIYTFSVVLFYLIIVGVVLHLVLYTLG